MMHIIIADVHDYHKIIMHVILSFCIAFKFTLVCMTYIHANFSLIFHTYLYVAYLVPKEFEGNIYLADLHDEPTTDGVLKVYTQGEWNLVCLRMNGEVVMNNAAAATACRQIGHPTVLDGGLKPAI